MHYLKKNNGKEVAVNKSSIALFLLFVNELFVCLSFLYKNLEREKKTCFKKAEDSKLSLYSGYTLEPWNL